MTITRWARASRARVARTGTGREPRGRDRARHGRRRRLVGLPASARRLRALGLEIGPVSDLLPLVLDVGPAFVRALHDAPVRKPFTLDEVHLPMTDLTQLMRAE